MNLLAIENRTVSSEYAWGSSDQVPFERVTLINGASEADAAVASRVLQRVLAEFSPGAIAVPGWSSPLALCAIRWASQKKIPVIVMSDSQAIDFRRVFWKEAIKKRVLRCCDAALVGGRPHRDYMVQLGMPAESIAVGYDVVDNNYFSAASAEVCLQPDGWRRELKLPVHYFLASARFIPKKNLVVLLRAYKLFLQRYTATQSGAAEWHLVILGDGELRPQIEQEIRSLELSGYVYLAGFRQIEELPAFYALAEAFILPSTTEQWGLVVNEAMASGLPVLVSERCGCAPDLVDKGKNGFTFNPFDIDEIADRMLAIATMEQHKREIMGAASREIVHRWSPETFANGLQQAVNAALAAPSRNVGLLDKLLLGLLSHR